jgi:hypothetical protein
MRRLRLPRQRRLRPGMVHDPQPEAPARRAGPGPGELAVPRGTNRAAVIWAGHLVLRACALSAPGSRDSGNTTTTTESILPMMHLPIMIYHCAWGGSRVHAAPIASSSRATSYPLAPFLHRRYSAHSSLSCATACPSSLSDSVCRHVQGLKARKGVFGAGVNDAAHNGPGPCAHAYFGIRWLACLCLHGRTQRRRNFGRLNDVAPSNIRLMFTTLHASHFSRDWLNEVAPSNKQAGRSRNAGHVPPVEGLVERSSAVERTLHVLDLGHVPLFEGLVERHGAVERPCS